MTSRRSTSRVAILVTIITVGAPAVAAPPRLALWLEGREALKLRGPIASAVGRDYKLVAPALVARELRKSKTRPTMQELATRLRAAVLYARVDGKTKQLAFAFASPRPSGETAERSVPRSALAATVRELLQAAPAVAAPAPPTVASAPAPPAASTPKAPPAASTPKAPPAASAPAARKPASRDSRAPAAASASAPTPAPVAANEAVEAAVAREAPPHPADTLFSIAVDGGIGARRLTYNQPLTDNLRAYSVAAVPWLGFRAAIYPFARTRTLVLRGLGAFADFGQSLYQQSVVVGGGPRYSATWRTFDVGARERLRFGSSKLAPTAGLALAYGGLGYNFEDAGQIISDTPSVDYRYLRPALDGRMTFGPVTVSVDAGYRAVLSSGYVGGRFPRAQIGGIDVGAGLALRLPHDLELRVSGQYIRFFYDLRPEPGDPYVAGGAVDEFAVGELALAYGF